MIKVKKYFKTTCAPCLSMGRILDKVGKKIDFELENIEVNDEPDRANADHVASVPTIIVVSEDGELERWQGVKSSKEVIEILGKYS